MGRDRHASAGWQTATVITPLIARGPAGANARRSARPASLPRAGRQRRWGSRCWPAGFSGQRHLIELALPHSLAAASAFYTFGGLSLMAVMSPDRHAGAYLDLWSISILVFRGWAPSWAEPLRDLSFCN